MAYVERDDRDLDLNEQSDFYDDDSMYDEIYSSENFGERVDNGSTDGDDGVTEVVTEEEVVVTNVDRSTDEKKTEDGFGETLGSEPDPRSDDRVDNQTQDASGEITSSKDVKKEGLFSKAKDKLDEWTEKDQRE